MSAHEAEPSSHRDLGPPSLNTGGDLSGWRDLPRRGRGLSLSTLIIIRWLAIMGQTAAILTAWFALHFDLPLGPCLLVIATSVVTNILVMGRQRRVDTGLPDGRQTATHLGFDILQLAALLALTGGLENPFSLLLVAPVTIAAAALPLRQAIALGVIAMMAVAALFYWSMPLPGSLGQSLDLPPL